MPMYLVTPLAHNMQALSSAAEAQLLREDFFVLANDAGMLVRSKGTSVELSNQLGISTEDRAVSRTGSAMVTSLTTYYGRGPTDMWEWLKTRFEGYA